ncbi:MAG: hypothetical protein C5B55_12185 [Blastocatellia bacterium]|nr:MAG: hypothetical protein C5B55_12185 [Blastocatellia bacterium]
MIRRVLILVLFSVVISGCHKNTPESSRPAEETASSSPRPSASPMTDFEKSLQFVRNGQYTYVFVFSRKDGKPLDSEDGQFLRTNAPQVVDWVTTQDKKKVIGGTNFNLEEGNLGVIKKRLVVEDYSGK